VSGRERVQGTVLLTTIIIVSILAILILSMMQAVFLYLKASGHVVVHQQEFYQLEAAAQKIAAFDKPLAHCVVQKINPNDIMSQLLSDKGCVLMVGDQRYQYLIDDLGEYPCLNIAYDKRIYGSHHWLISIATSESAILQIRLVKRAETPRCKQVEEREVHEGISSWRYLSDNR